MLVKKDDWKAELYNGREKIEAFAEHGWETIPGTDAWVTRFNLLNVFNQRSDRESTMVTTYQTETPYEDTSLHDAEQSRYLSPSELSTASSNLHATPITVDNYS